MIAARQGDRKCKLLAHAEAATARLARAFDLMMEVGRLELGNVQPNIRPSRLGSFLMSFGTNIRKTRSARGIAFRVVASDLVILTDPELLGSILHNLVGNAVKYTERRGVLVGCRRRGDHALIQVWDTGRGIPCSMLGLIFEEYQQLAPLSSTRDRPGLSIGQANRRSIGPCAGGCDRPSAVAPALASRFRSPAVTEARTPYRAAATQSKHRHP
jgi:signal transduction histidine kinase